MSDQYFHFTLGPVQGFVSQARRTRDFWAGSFLLSWLSGVAMLATKQQGGIIEFPAPPEGYLDWIAGEGNESDEPPRQGAIPNRFKAFQAKVPETFDGGRVALLVREAWFALAEEIWKKDLAPYIQDSTQRQRSRTVWERQHSHFWEITWIISPDRSASNLLDRRKNWRNHLPPPEPGVKCMLMEGWQELSGIDGMGDEDNNQRRAFWQILHHKMSSGMTDLGEHEMLCGLALVKRRFARHFGQFEWLSLNHPGFKLKGWTLDVNMPSVAYMAAVHWLEKLVENIEFNELEQLYNAAMAAGCQRDEWRTEIACLNKALAKFTGRQGQVARKFIALDGNMFFEHVLAQPKRYGFNDRVTEVKKILQDFRKNNPRFKDEPLSPFYAILMMDGDSLGSHMSDENKQKPIASALNKFTQIAPKTVRAHNGFLIYAGGDDVLAILPLEDALTCAAALREEYQKSFQDTGIPTTLSGAIIYAHVKVALGEVLRQAHTVLDEIAKDETGRDAIAVRVIKPGGVHLTWAQPWEIALDEKKPVIEGLAADFQAANKADDTNEVGSTFSSKFFFKIQARFEVLADMNEDVATHVLMADYAASGPSKNSGGKNSLETIKDIIQPLLKQCRGVKRATDKPVDEWKKEKPTADAALLVRFLATKGIGGRA